MEAYEVQRDLIEALKLIFQMRENIKRSVLLGLEPDVTEMAQWTKRVNDLLIRYPNIGKKG